MESLSAFSTSTAADREHAQAAADQNQAPLLARHDPSAFQPETFDQFFDALQLVGLGGESAACILAARSALSRSPSTI